LKRKGPIAKLGTSFLRAEIASAIVGDVKSANDSVDYRLIRKGPIGSLGNRSKQVRDVLFWKDARPEPDSQSKSSIREKQLTID